ncbi:MAG: LysM domain-containing protein [Bacteroidota bacterium]|nr:LysM domain-containing protein [Bacteroidota bacterium]
MSHAEKQKSLNKKPTFSSTANKVATSPTEKNTTVTSQNNGSNSDFVYYTVRQGDNLWTIARKFPGISNQDIMKINNIKAAESLMVGQKLKIMPKT